MKVSSKKSLAIAVDVGGTNLRTAVVDRKGNIIRKIVAKTVQKGRSGQVVANQVIGEMKEITQGVNLNRVAGIGVSIAGPIDRKKGGSSNPPNMNFEFVPVIRPLKKSFHLPVYLINDCNVGALGEKYFGDGKKIDNFVYITISSGIGGGAFVNGNLLLGKGGNAVEIGHMIVDTEYNLLCSCRKGRGHWEAYASGNNLPKFFKAWLKRRNIKGVKFFYSSAKDIFEAVKKRDKVALSFMEELGKINGRGFSNVIAAYDPEMIVLGGKVALNNSVLILRYAKKYIDDFLRLPRIKVTALGENAPLLGAAAKVWTTGLD